MSVNRIVASTVSGSAAPDSPSAKETTSSARPSASQNSASEPPISTSRAPGIRSAMYSASPRARSVAVTSVGTRIDGRTSRTSTAAAMRAMTTAAPGLAPSRITRAHHSCISTSAASVGENMRRSSAASSRVPQRVLMSSSQRSFSASER